MNSIFVALMVVPVAFLSACSPGNESNELASSAPNEPATPKCQNFAKKDCDNKQTVKIENPVYAPKIYQLTDVAANFLDQHKEYFANRLFEDGHLDIAKWNNIKTYEDKSVHRDFSENEVGANLKYSEPFSMKGTARKFSSGIRDVPSITFNVGNAFESVIARFEPEQAIYVAKLKKGEPFEIWCTKAEDFMSSAILSGCITPAEIKDLKINTFASSFVRFLDGKNPDINIAQHSFFNVLNNERRLPFSLCPKNMDECTENDINKNLKNKNPHLYEELELAQSYYIGKFSYILKSIYGDKFILSLVADDKKLISDPGYIFRNHLQKIEVTHKDSKLVDLFKKEYADMTKFKF